MSGVDVSPETVLKCGKRNQDPGTNHTIIATTNIRPTFVSGQQRITTEVVLAASVSIRQQLQRSERHLISVSTSRTACCVSVSVGRSVSPLPSQANLGQP